MNPKLVGLGLGLSIAAGLAGLWLAGFAVHAMAVATPAPDPVPAGDGIVVLTGTPERLTAGLALARDRPNARLLLSGIDWGTDPRHIAALRAGAPALFAARVDLGREARDTAENAGEAAAWARRHGFRTLLVVSSDWHLPRGLIELRRRLPQVRLIGWPVAGGDDGLALRLAEFHKTLYSLAAALLSPRP